jgi:hypothetical protein
MASSSSSRLHSMLQNLHFNFLCWQQTKHQYHHKKNNGVLQRAKKHFWSTMDVEIFKANNHFKAANK